MQLWITQGSVVIGDRVLDREAHLLWKATVKIRNGAVILELEGKEVAEFRVDRVNIVGRVYLAGRWEAVGHQGEVVGGPVLPEDFPIRGQIRFAPEGVFLELDTSSGDKLWKLQ